MTNFYVYAFFDGETCLYVGKGTGRRIKTQQRRFGCEGVVLRTFATEAAAYNFEAREIERRKPTHNMVAGGGGAITRRKARIPAFLAKEMAEMNRLGSRVYTARSLLRFDLSRLVSPSKIDEIRRIAHG
jgi:hypothetical protein